MIDYTLTDEYLEAVQVNEGTWLGLDIGRAFPPQLQQLYAVNKAAAIEFNNNAWASLGQASGAGGNALYVDTASAQRLAVFADHYDAQPIPRTDEEIQAQVLRNREQYEQARAVLQAQREQNAMPRRSQQDEQLDMAYRNGLEDGEVLGRAEMLRTVAKVCTVVLAVGILSTFIILGVMP